MTEQLIATALVALLTGILIGWLAFAPGRPPRRCDAYPLDYVRCSRRHGHTGEHTVYPSAVRKAHYERTPF